MSVQHKPLLPLLGGEVCMGTAKAILYQFSYKLKMIYNPNSKICSL